MRSACSEAAASHAAKSPVHRDLAAFDFEVPPTAFELQLSHGCLHGSRQT
jgi:hypothetical protein